MRSMHARGLGKTHRTNEVVWTQELFARIDKDGSTWTFEKDPDEAFAVVSCEKVDADKWPRLGLNDN